MSKPILCLDFDGVLHSYTSGWRGADAIPDDPVPGAMQFLAKAIDVFNVQIFSSRSEHFYGIFAMRKWLRENLAEELGPIRAYKVYNALSFPKSKPPALVTIDDRAVTFTGIFPEIEDLFNFKPWNKR